MHMSRPEAWSIIILSSICLLEGVSINSEEVEEGFGPEGTVKKTVRSPGVFIAIFFEGNLPIYKIETR